MVSMHVSTLSGGESQRVKMARQLDCNLTDLLYVLDEPSVGLHPRDTERLIALFNELRDKGNSVFVVEHDPDIIRCAEWVVDMGPKAGSLGGSVIYNGTAEGLLSAEGLTAEQLRKRLGSDSFRPTRQWSDYYLIENACENNLKNITVRIPKGVLTVVTGVSGCGKSSLIHGCFVPQHPEACVINQEPVGRTTRGNIVSYMGVFNHIRKLFSETTGQEQSLFSFNAAGACPKCEGRGFLSFEMSFLDAVRTKCDDCNGKRYNSRAQSYKYKGKDISEVLDLTVNQAVDFFGDVPSILKHITLLQDVGLGYLTLGQSLSSLSGGESQRLKIATVLKKTGGLYVMDEPTTGLHMNDIENFFCIIDRLVNSGNTVIIIEHNPDIIRRADWMIDLGPEGGSKGGYLLFEGRPCDAVSDPHSITGRFL